MPTKSKRLLVASLAGVLALAGCHDSRVRYEDFVVSGHVVSSKETKEATQVWCADRTVFALSLSQNEELAVVTSLGAAPELVLAGCLSPPGGASGGSLGLIVEAVDGSRRRQTRLDLSGGWWRQEFDLSEFAGRQARIRLAASPGAAGSLYLSDFFVEHRVAAPSVERQARQILLISVDTLRADALGALGGGVPTPALDALVAESQVWSPHYAAASWTKPSHASLLTGYYPDTHGAIDPESAMYPAVVTLAERLRRAGFLTSGLVHDCLWLNPEFGFARGFDEYRSVKWHLSQMVRQVVNWVGDHRHTSFFLFLHTFEVHSDFQRLPYEAPGVSRDTVQDRFGVPGYGCITDAELVCATERLLRIDSGQIEPLRQEDEILRFLYTQGVVEMDEQLGLLFERLRQLGMFDRMMIVFTADHGEQFLEHGGTLHDSYWEEIVRVPLIVKWPRGRFAGERRSVVSSAVDVAPTLLEAFGLQADDLPGARLLERRSEQPVFVGTTWHAVIVDRLKGVFHRPSGFARLYDLQTDAEERHDLSDVRAQETAALRNLLAAHRSALARRQEEGRPGAEATAPRLSEEDKQRLRSLGYLGNH